MTVRDLPSEQQQSDFYRAWALEHWDLVNRLAKRRFADSLLAEEAALYVLERLSDDQWRSLRNYRGAAKLTTYFSVLVSHRLEDFARQRFGRVRPPQWLMKLGGIWLLLYRLLCHQRISLGDATEIAADSYQQLSTSRIEQMAERILGEIPSCGQPQQPLNYSEETAGDDGSHRLAEQTERLERKQREQVLAGLYCQLLGEPVDLEKGKLLDKLVSHPIQLSPEERLLLKLCHRDGLSITEAGRMLGLNRFQTHGKMRRLYRRLRTRFEQGGLAEELKLILADESDT